MKKQDPTKQKTRPDLDDENWLAWTAAQPENRGIDVRSLYRKMLDWCQKKGEIPTRRRLLRWLDDQREAVPIATKPPQDADCKNCGNERRVIINDLRSPCPECQRTEYDAFWRARGK